MKQSLPISLLIIAAFCSLFCSCTSEGERQHMAQIIAEADSLNRNYITLTSDSLLLEASQYYDRFGSPNERMKAHYLLGCVYRDLGEAPRAIECYQDAIACADTTSTACDHYTLCRVHGQASWILYGQQLPNEMLEELTLYEKHAILAKDTLTAIDAFSRRADAYDLLAMDDSVIAIHERTYDRYMAVGNPSLAVMDVCAMVSALIDKGQLEKAAKYLSEYETLSGLFDENGNIDEQYNIYYYIKGKYHLAVSQLDSAEHMFRKALALSQNPNETEGGYQGLFQLYKRKHNPDSVSKYAELYCAVNDSSFVLKDQNLTARLAASYNYAHYQKLSLDNEKKAYRANLRSIIILSFTLILLIALLFSLKVYRDKQRQKQLELDLLKNTFAETVERYEQKKVELEKFETKSKELNASYEEEKAELAEQVAALQGKIDEMKMQKDMSKYLERSATFCNRAVVRQIKELASNPFNLLEAQQQKELINTTGEFFADFVHDLFLIKDISQQSVAVCILAAMNFRTDDIAHLLNVSGQRITNVKRELNKALFDDGNARSLTENIKRKYNIFILQ